MICLLCSVQQRFLDNYNYFNFYATLGETARTAIVCSPGKVQSIVEGFKR